MTEPAPLESGLENFFRQRVRLMGGVTIKLAPTEAGIPDRLVIFPPNRIYLVELKRSTGMLSLVQRAWHAKVAQRTGAQVHVLYGKEDVVTWIRQIVGARDPRSRDDDALAAR